MSLINKSAVIANSIGNIDRCIWATSLNHILKDCFILLCGEMFVKIHVESRATIKIFSEVSTMKNELIYYTTTLIFYEIEVAIVAISGNKISILFVPFCVFNTKILCQFCYFNDQCFQVLFPLLVEPLRRIHKWEMYPNRYSYCL